MGTLKSRVLLAQNDLMLHEIISRSPNKRLDLENFRKTIPEILRRFVEDHQDRLLNLFFGVRNLSPEALEEDFVSEVADLIFQLADADLRGDAAAAAARIGGDPLAVYVGLAIYSKHLATAGPSPAVRQAGQHLERLRDGVDTSAAVAR